MTSKAQLDARYGRVRRPARRRLLWATVAVVAVAAVGYLGWTTVSGTLDDVAVDDTGYRVLDENAVEVSFQVSAPQGRDIACALEALDKGFGVVGWRIVRYPAGESHAAAFTERVRTVGEATTGLVKSCWTI